MEFISCARSSAQSQLHERRDKAREVEKGSRGMHREILWIVADLHGRSESETSREGSC